MESSTDSASDFEPPSDSSDSPSSSGPSSASRASHLPLPSVPAKRQQTIYDAVARKSCRDRFLYSNKSISKPGKYVHTRAVPPETILASRWQLQLRHAGRHEEIDDVKLMQAGLVIPSQRDEALPNSDLLEAIHYYAAEFYEKQGLHQYCVQQYDASALLALGIVVEELVRECLGKEGHKVFMEEDETRVEDEGVQADNRSAASDSSDNEQPHVISSDEDD